ncbi:DUF3604 domain-containing protein [Parvularcula sp. IMCC14364]|uniref:DUF3604 domain-containing protein n=1 Tax=Parvularcula sp. IMCC14364 TaxID=3067902 RepID=UPI0027416B97|nr:DUF3604 domain-containing protein [Parvularcula sp. IMCC14364]
MRIIIGLVIVLAMLLGGWHLFDRAVMSGKLGEERTAGTIVGDAVPTPVVIARQQADAAVAPASSEKQILFGDLHVHTTYSTDAFLWALPLNHGKGVHPLADACDFARYCSAMDFWAITDHAEAATPARWAEAKKSLRQCQAKALDQDNPDLVSFLGFEWTQVGAIPTEHFGHKNVIFEGLDDDNVSARPIAAIGGAMDALRTNAFGMPAGLSLLDWGNRDVYWDFNTYIKNVQATPLCDADLPSSELPADCYEAAATPGDLVARLEDQGLDPLIIPHGSTWGFYTPPGTTWDKQLEPAQRPEAFSLLEIYSGHGNSEEYRDYIDVIASEDGLTGICPEKTPTYTPACVRAGEIIEERCLAEGDSADDCSARAAEARDATANMAIAYHLAIGGESVEDWLESGQCTDCYLPAFNYRPKTSAQYGLAISRFDDAGEPVNRFNWGFIASSDNHRARPGTGYKEVARRMNTEAGGVIKPEYRSLFLQDDTPRDAQIYRRTREELQAIAGFQLTEIERQSTFWQTGGLAAVHSEGRSRAEIWDALQRRETYATSGPRMLLWFDRVDPDGASAPMGATVETSEAGTFTVKATGSFKQKPGCPDYAMDALGEDRISSICSGECYNPSDERNLIQRIEIIRIRPQISPDEDVGDLIDDPFLVHNCPADQAGCSFTFTDAAFSAGGRDALYYARAIQEPRPTINADALRCERDEEGNCIKPNICYGDWRTGDEDCTAPMDVRAWSSPIYLTYTSQVASGTTAPSLE